MQTVRIENQTYQAKEVPTTLADNAGGIINRWLLYQGGVEVGRLVEWYGSRFYRVIGKIREVFSAEDVDFSSQR